MYALEWGWLLLKILATGPECFDVLSITMLRSYSGSCKVLWDISRLANSAKFSIGSCILIWVWAWSPAVAVAADVTVVFVSTLVFLLAFLSSLSPFSQLFPSFYTPFRGSSIWRPNRLRNHSWKTLLSTKHLPVSGQPLKLETEWNRKSQPA